MEQIANVELDLWGLLAGNGGFFGFRWKIGFDGIKLVNGPSQAIVCFWGAILNVLRGTFSTLAPVENYFGAFLVASRAAYVPRGTQRRT